MADNIQFLRGLQTSLDNKTSFIEGAFYLTTDTERLYYAKSASEIAYLNKYITTVANVTELQKLTLSENNIGDFYYVTDGNILCFYNGGAKDSDDLANWTQVNAQTIDTDTKVGSFTIAETAATAEKITFTATLKQVDKSGNEISAETKTTSFDIEKADINALVDHPAIEVGVAAISNGATVTISAEGEDAFNIKGGDNVTVAVNGDDITISSSYVDTNTKYDIASPAGSTNIVLKEDGNDKTTIKFVDDEQDIEITGVNGNEIKVAHKVYNTKDETTVKDEAAIGNKGTFKVLKDVTVENGHVTGIETADITLNITDENDNTIVKSVSADDSGKITIGLMDKDGETLNSVVSTQDLFYKFDNSIIYNQGDLAVPVKAYFNSQLKALNALTFKGNIASDTDLTNVQNAGVSIGDVYIVTATSLKDIPAVKGDMIIANGTEEDGVITSETLEWIVVDGEEENTTYTLEANSNQIKLIDDDGNDDSAVNLADDDVVILTSADNTITAKHKEYTAKDTEDIVAEEVTLNHSGKFTAVTGFVSDSHGHVTEVNTTEFTLPTLPDQTNDHKLAKKDNKIELQNKAGDAKGSIEFVKGNTITATVDGTNPNLTVTVNHDDVDCTVTENTEAVSLVKDSEFVVVTGVSSNAQGHITSITTQKYKTTDNDTKYALSGATVAEIENGVSVTDALKTTAGADAGTSTFNLVSANNNLIVEEANGNIQLNLTWGTF